MDVVTRRFTVLLGLAVLALSATSAWATYGSGDPSLWHPLRHAVTESGHHIDRLYWGIFILTAVVFVVVEIMLVYFAIRYRATPGGKAKFIHGNNRLEAAWTITPSIILVLIAALSKGTWDEIRTYPPNSDDVVKIECVAQQFAWFFRYSGNDGTFGPRKTEALEEARANNDTVDPIQVDREFVPDGWAGENPPGADDYTIQAELRVPADRDVRILLTSNDVIHSFFIPEFRVKHDVIPGMNGGRLWFNVSWDQAKNHGYFDLECAELCGLNHYSMKGKVIVMRSGPVHPDALAKDAQTWLDEFYDDESAVMAWLDEQTWETYAHVMSKITLAENSGEGGYDDGY